MVDVLSCFHWRDQITNSLVLGDHVALGRRQSARLSCTGGCPEDKNTLFEEALADRFSQVLPEASAVDGQVPLTVMVRTIFFRSEECGIFSERGESVTLTAACFDPLQSYSFAFWICL